MAQAVNGSKQPAAAEEAAEGLSAAREAGLRYVTDTMPGIRRERTGETFRYIGPDDKPVTDAAALRRIAALAVPPAWTDVWICASPRGHIQATGRDAKGRKVYRYHERWREVRSATKYHRMVAFGEALPLIRQRVDQDLARRGLPREKILATVVRLLETTHIRVGNEEYVRENGSFGLTTLRHQHIDISGSTLRFQFRGKSGKHHVVDVQNPRLARIVRRCQEIPGHELFQYLEGKEHHTIESDDVNNYLRTISGQDFTAKDFRTWAGTILAARELAEMEIPESDTHGKKNVAHAVKSVASQLGNTPTVCRTSYIHPAIIDAYLGGSLRRIWNSMDEATLAGEFPGLNREELLVLSLLQNAGNEQERPSP
ncbi:DNA topoisomerase IB [Nitrolancea hollandica]|uniref:DNA topoisomerase n=1 Tax=Nitrolancea hollandica Lb TaxID=1129897 RepID=I4EF89_9BACT